MAIDLSTFRVAFPEFKDAPDDLVAAKLAYATLLVPIGVWGAQQELGAFLYTARFLACSPYARKMALANKVGVTLYDADLDRLKRMVTSGFRVL